MEYEFTREEAALLYVLHGEEPPPLIDIDVYGTFADTASESAQSLERSLTSRALLVYGEEGSRVLDEGLARILATCFEAKIALMPEIDGVVTSATYLLDDDTAIVARSGERIVFRAVDSLEQRTHAFVETLGATPLSTDRSVGLLSLSEDEAEHLLEVYDAEGSQAISDLCLQHGWDAATVDDVLAHVIPEDIGRVRLSVYFREAPFFTSAKVACDGDHAWVLKSIVGDEERSIHLIRCAPISLLSVLVDIPAVPSS